MEAFKCFPVVTPRQQLFPPEIKHVKLPFFPKIRVSNPTSIRVSASVGKTSNASSNSKKATRVPNDLQQPKPTATRAPNPPRSPKPDKESPSDELRRESQDILEWRAVCAQVAAFASTAAGRAACREGRLPVGRDREESQRLLDQTAAAVSISKPLDFSGVGDVSELVRTAVSRELLTIPQLCAVERSLRSARQVFEQLKMVSDEGGSPDRYYPLLDILQKCDFLTELTNSIGYCIDSTLSIVLDRASTKLEKIRSERRENSKKLESLLKEVSMKVFQAGGIDSPVVTKRRSRMCVGIKASHKYLLSDGIILSLSSSGATYFIEPRDAVELNNMEVRLLNSEKAEEFAILSFLTSEIADAKMKIRHLMEKILELDLAFARGTYALWMNGVCPIFSEDHRKTKSNGELLPVDITGIRHPLLLEPSLRSLSSFSGSEASISRLYSERDVMVETEILTKCETSVPIDIKIGPTIKVVVISGPNTGGKTATLKTLGLASLMSKAGMFLPAKKRPVLPWFDQILVDIGDHQSLEHNLSTFSGHISCLRKILEVASQESLVLIDEIGSGTDPSESVALSTSILQHLAGCVNLAMVTTHYADLSLLKAVDSRFENAAMEFSMETLLPTYRILWGSTGNSNALSIAKSIGVDQKVLDRAQKWVEKLVPDKQKERHGLLYQSLLEEKNILEAQAREATSVLSRVKKLYLEIQSEAEDLGKREAALKAKESQMVQQEIKYAKSQMDVVVKNFESKLHDTSPDQFSTLMRESEAVIASIVATHCPDDNMLYEETDTRNSYVPQLGDRVFVKGLGDKEATVVEAPAEDGTTMVQYGKIKVRVKRNGIKLIQSSMTDARRSPLSQLKQHEHQRYYGRDQMDVNQVEPSFGPAVRTSKNTVDLRGMRGEEASHHLHMAISGCRSYGVLFVVHGTGTGVVKERVLDILRNHPRVAKFEEESPMNYGCTVAYIK